MLEDWSLNSKDIGSLVSDIFVHMKFLVTNICLTTTFIPLTLQISIILPFSLRCYTDSISLSMMVMREL